MGLSMRRNPFHPGVFDADLLLQGEFVVPSVDPNPEPGLAVLVVCDAGEYCREGVVAQGENRWTSTPERQGRQGR